MSVAVDVTGIGNVTADVVRAMADSHSVWTAYDRSRKLVTDTVIGHTFNLGSGTRIETALAGPPDSRRRDDPGVVVLSRQQDAAPPLRLVVSGLQTSRARVAREDPRSPQER